MKSLTYAFSIVLMLAFSSIAQTADATPKTNAPVLRVEVDGGKTLDLTAKDLAKFARREIRAKAHDEKEAVYSGFNLSEILLAAGARVGKDELRGKELAGFLTVEAADGYRAVFALAELSADFTDKIILVADMRDGKPLDEKNGAWQIIVPGEKKHGRWVRQVIKLTVKKADGGKSADIEIKDLKLDENAIHKIIFKNVLGYWGSASSKNIKAYYLAINGGDDPGDDLLKMLGGYKFPLKKSSDCYPDESDQSLIVDKETKERGELFTISKLEWKSGNEVKASASKHGGNLGGNWCDYFLKKEKGEWKIVTEECYVS